MSAWKSAKFRLIGFFIICIIVVNPVVFLLQLSRCKPLWQYVGSTVPREKPQQISTLCTGIAVLILLHSSKSCTHFIFLLLHVCIFSSYVIYCIGPRLTLWLPSFKPASLNIICTCPYGCIKRKLITQYCSFISSFQAQNDPFRLVRYDISLATHGLTQSQPLLLRRHNAVPGMFLVS